MTRPMSASERGQATEGSAMVNGTDDYDDDDNDDDDNGDVDG